MSGVPQDIFQSMYAGQPPWETGKPQKAFVDIADQIQGSILDAGCGTGENALYFAERGHPVTAFDLVDEAIRRAQQKAKERNLPVTFLVKNALALKDWNERFDSVIDSGLFHVFSDKARQRYVEGLATVLKPGGKLFLACFSDQEPGTHGPRRITKLELLDAFAHGWVVESLVPSRYETIPVEGFTFSAGGPKAWLAVIQRAG